MYQRVDADYYGYRDDDDGLLEKLEAEKEAECMGSLNDNFWTEFSETGLDWWVEQDPNHEIWKSEELSASTKDRVRNWATQGVFATILGSHRFLGTCRSPNTRGNRARNPPQEKGRDGEALSLVTLMQTPTQSPNIQTRFPTLFVHTTTCQYNIQNLSIFALQWYRIFGLELGFVVASNRAKLWWLLLLIVCHGAELRRMMALIVSCNWTEPWRLLSWVSCDRSKLRRLLRRISSDRTKRRLRSWMCWRYRGKMRVGWRWRIGWAATEGGV